MFTLVLGEGSAAIDNAELQMAQMSGAGAQQQLDYNKLYAGEKNELEIMNVQYDADKAERRLLLQVT